MCWEPIVPENLEEMQHKGFALTFIQDKVRRRYIMLQNTHCLIKGHSNFSMENISSIKISEKFIMLIIP